MEGSLFIGTILCYSVGSILLIGAFSFKKEALLKYGIYVVSLGFIFHTLTISVRIIASGHIPVVGNYENTLTGSWFIVLFSLALHRWSRLGAIALATIPFSMLMLGYGWMSGTEIEPLTPPYQTIWLYIHVFFAWLAYGSYTIAFGIAVLYLISEKIRKITIFSIRKDILDDLMFRYTIFGFITDAVMIAAGSIWASKLWGHYWGWDPVEVWSLLSWLIYGNLIHLRLIFGWRGRKVAWYLVFAIITVVISFWGVNLITKSLHDFRLS